MLFTATTSAAADDDNNNKDADKNVLFNLPPVLVKLNNDRRTAHLKAYIALELADPKMRERVEKLLPRVLDSIQVYLREARLSDFETSKKLRRIRKQLRVQLNAAIKPAKVNDVVFKKVLLDD